MKKMEPGLLLLLVATFFLIVAGGHVTLDARPATGSSIGIVLTLLAAVLAAVGAWLASRKRTSWDGEVGAGMLVLAGGIVLLDLLSGGDMIAAVRMLAGLAVFGALAHVLTTRRVVQMPGTWYGGLVVVVVAAMGASLVVSEFVAVSLDGWQYWLLYAAGFYLAVASLGRVRGPRMLVETVLSMLTGRCNTKRMRHRVWKYFRMHLAWTIAAFNLMLDGVADQPHRQGQPAFSIADYVL